MSSYSYGSDTKGNDQSRFMYDLTLTATPIDTTRPPYYSLPRVPANYAPTFKIPSYYQSNYTFQSVGNNMQAAASLLTPSSPLACPCPINYSPSQGYATLQNMPQESSMYPF
jgi:hypothetical protein